MMINAIFLFAAITNNNNDYLTEVNLKCQT